ncbi:MAG TPA: DUF1622 domain-containing protein [Actinomycetales bacterium]|nr:DUF1622 domain-containing protein [Actinomycetales bacterium]
MPPLLGDQAETTLQHVVSLLVIFVEAAGAFVIVVGAVWAFVGFVRVLVARGNAEMFVPVRLLLGRFLTLGLEFQLASDVLRTAVSPSFEELGKLAAVATIRTALNYFLTREIAEERRQVAEARAAGEQARQGTAQQAGDTR